MTDEAMNFRLPGPTPLPPQVLAAMQRPMIPHRGPAFKALYRDTLRLARLAHRTEHPVLTWPGSGSAGWEAAIVNLLAPGDPVLATSCGAFGERFAQVGVAFGLDVRRLEAPWGEAIQPAALKAAMEANPEVRAVFITHNETSTGVTNPLKELAAVVRDHGALAIVDGVSGAGALPLEFDAWGIDVLLSGSQKAWMTPPGLMIAAVGPRAWGAVARSGYPRFFWDLEAARKAADEGMTPTTPPLTMIYAFHAALEMMAEEGMENIWERHRRLGDLTRTGLCEAGLRVFGDPAHASDTVTAKQFLARLREEHRVEAQGGQGAYADSMVRLGHMGWVEEPEMREAVAACAAVARSFAEAGAPA